MILDPYSVGIVTRYDPLFDDIISRAQAEAFLIPLTFYSYGNDLIKGLRSSGMLDKSDVFHNWGHGTDYSFYQDFKRINWVNPAGTLANYVGSIVHTAAGVHANNSNANYIVTEFNPATGTWNYTQNDASFGGFVHSVGGYLNSIIIGKLNLTDQVRLGSSNVNKINQGVSNSSSAYNFAGNGYTGLHRINATDVIGVKGDDEQLRTATSQAINNAAFRLLRSSTVSSTCVLSYSHFGASCVDEVKAFNVFYKQWLSSIGQPYTHTF